MIYIQKSVYGNKMQLVTTNNNEDLFYFHSIKPQTYKSEDIEQLVLTDKDDKKPYRTEYQNKLKKYAKEQGLYCICGEVKDNIRKNENIINRTLIFIDFEDTGIAENDFISKIKKDLKIYNWATYPTALNTENNPRYRLVLKPNRPIVNEDEYKVTIKEITDKINLPYDHTSNTWSQLQGLPICNEKDLENYKIIKHTGGSDYLVVTPTPKNKPILNNNVYSNINRPLQNKKQKNGIVLEHNKAIEIFMDYIENDKENLQTYDNFLTVIMVLAKSVQDSIIELDTALLCSELLAFDNPEWIEENRNILINTLKKDIRTEYTFFNKFIVWSKKEPKTNAELMEILKKVGYNEKIKNAEIKKDGTLKLQSLSYATVVKILLNYCHFINLSDVKYDDKSELYIYDLEQQIYISSNLFIDRIIDSIDDNFTKKFRDEVKAKLRNKAPFKKPFNIRYLIPCNNGIYDLENKKLLPFSPDYPITSKIATNYVENAPRPKYFDFDSWLSSIACDDKELILLFWQIINECVNSNYTRGKFALFVGEGNNGKGTFQDLIINLVGKNNISSIPPQDFEKRFALSQLLNKNVNIADDISSEYISNPSFLKSMVTGDVITIEEKFKNSINANLKIFHLFSCNKIPKIRDNTNGIYRRMLIVPFNADFNGKENRAIKEKHLKDKTVLEYVLYKALNLDFENFTTPTVCEEMLKEYKKDNDYFEAYIIDEYIANEYHTIERVPVVLIKYSYEHFLYENKLTQHIPREISPITVKKLNTHTKNIYTVKKERLRIDDYKELVKKGMIHDNEHNDKKYNNKAWQCIIKNKKK